MKFAPQQDWAAYRALTAQSDADWIRGLSVQERFALYCDLFNIVWNAPRDPEKWKRLEDWRWQQKLKARLRFVAAFREYDTQNRE